MSETEILLPNGRSWDLVPIESIQYIESDKKLCRVVTVEREYWITASLYALESRLSNLHFVRIHKSYLVSLRYIHSIGKTELKVAGKLLPVSRRARPALYRRYSRFS